MPVTPHDRTRARAERRDAERTTTPPGEVGRPLQSLARRRRAVVPAADRALVGLPIGVADRGNRDGHSGTGQQSGGCRAGEHPLKTSPLGRPQHDELRVLLDGGYVQASGRRAGRRQPHLVDLHLRSSSRTRGVSHVLGLGKEPAHLGSRASLKVPPSSPMGDTYIARSCASSMAAMRRARTITSRDRSRPSTPAITNMGALSHAANSGAGRRRPQQEAAAFGASIGDAGQNVIAVQCHERVVCEPRPASVV